MSESRIPISRTQSVQPWFTTLTNATDQSDRATLTSLVHLQTSMQTLEVDDKDKAKSLYMGALGMVGVNGATDFDSNGYLILTFPLNPNTALKLWYPRDSGVGGIVSGRASFSVANLMLFEAFFAEVAPILKKLGIELIRRQPAVNPASQCSMPMSSNVASSVAYFFDQYKNVVVVTGGGH